MLNKILTHIDKRGDACMVDIAEKPSSKRMAVAEAYVTMNKDTLMAVIEDRHRKGDVIAAARLAGILSAKKTAEIIPLCHPLLLTHIEVDILPDVEKNQIKILGSCSLYGKTGVEMEALMAVSIAALTIYDMCKAIQKDIIIGPIRLLNKTGGKSGNFRREPV